MSTVTQAVQARRSTRAFLNRPVALETVTEILEIAAGAPSGGNLQPWYVDVLTGEALAELKARVAAVLATLPAGEGTEFDIYPSALGAPWWSRRRARPVRAEFRPVRGAGRPQWAHLGMFMQNVMLLAAERVLAICAQEAWALFHKTVGACLELPADRLFYCGMALGFADDAHPIN